MQLLKLEKRFKQKDIRVDIFRAPGHANIKGRLDLRSGRGKICIYRYRSGMKAMTAPRQKARLRRKLPRQKYIFFPSRSTKRYNSNFFSLYQLQKVLLTIANKKKYLFSRNYDFISNLTCARGMKDPAVPLALGSISQFSENYLTRVLCFFK